MKIETFNRETTTLLQDEIAAFWKAMEEKYNVKLQKQTASMAEKECRFTMVVRAEGVGQTEAQLAKLHDFPELGARFASNGDVFEVIGWEFKRPKFPVKAKNIKTGKVLLFTDAVKKSIELFARSK